MEGILQLSEDLRLVTGQVENVFVFPKQSRFSGQPHAESDPADLAKLLRNAATSLTYIADNTFKVAHRQSMSPRRWFQLWYHVQRLGLIAGTTTTVSWYYEITYQLAETGVAALHRLIDCDSQNTASVVAVTWIETLSALLTDPQRLGKRTADERTVANKLNRQLARRVLVLATRLTIQPGLHHRMLGLAQHWGLKDPLR